MFIMKFRVSQSTGPRTVVWRVYLTSFYILLETKNRTVGKVTFSSEIH